MDRLDIWPASHHSIYLREIREIAGKIFFLVGFIACAAPLRSVYYGLVLLFQRFDLDPALLHSAMITAFSQLFHDLGEYVNVSKGTFELSLDSILAPDFQEQLRFSIRPHVSFFRHL